MVKVEAELENTVEVAEHVAGNIYEANMQAPEVSKSNEQITTYDLKITAEGDNGEVTEETTNLNVAGASIFPLQFIVTKENGEEVGFAKEISSMDMELGEKNDFEMQMQLAKWEKEKYYFKHRIFIPWTEYGGIIEEMEPSTEKGVIKFGGYTWRGLLYYKVVEPPEGQDHLILNGELNNVLRELIGERFGSLFSVPDIDTGIVVTNWIVDRYERLLDVITKLLDENKHRIQIEYYEPEGLDYGHVNVQAVPITDYSNELEYSNDGKVNITVKDCRSGINHLVCVGTGQNEERIVSHLYVQEDGSIGKTQFYFGEDAREDVYEYTSADAAKLEEGGIKRLQELQNYKSVAMTVEDRDLELGDIVAGYEQITDTYVKQTVCQKIQKIQNGKTIMDYKEEGDD